MGLVLLALLAVASASSVVRVFIWTGVPEAACASASSAGWGDVVLAVTLPSEMLPPNQLCVAMSQCRNGLGMSMACLTSHTDPHPEGMASLTAFGDASCTAGKWGGTVAMRSGACVALADLRGIPGAGARVPPAVHALLAARQAGGGTAVPFRAVKAQCNATNTNVMVFNDDECEVPFPLPLVPAFLNRCSPAPSVLGRLAPQIKAVSAQCTVVPPTTADSGSALRIAALVLAIVVVVGAAVGVGILVFRRRRMHQADMVREVGTAPVNADEHDFAPADGVEDLQHGLSGDERVAPVLGDTDLEEGL